MKTIKKQIEVMQAYNDGAEIEHIEYTNLPDGEWWLIKKPKWNWEWNWGFYDYRIKEKPTQTTTTVNEALKEQIKIMQAYVDGVEIEYFSKTKGSDGKWRLIKTYTWNWGWNWECYDYRIKIDSVFVNKYLNKKDSTVHFNRKSAEIAAGPTAIRVAVEYREVK